MNSKPRRRLQFSLRTMLVVVMLVCVGFGYWVHWSKEWIRQRREWPEAHLYDPRYEATAVMARIVPPPRPTAPGGLWLFGEEGVGLIFVYSGEESLAAQLFPEAVQWKVDRDNWRD